MKYIRTKDKIIAFGEKYAYPTRIVKGNQRYIFTELTETTFEKMKDFNNWEIIAKADTIEELCDEFVYNNQLLNPYYISPKDTELIAFRNRLEYEFKEKNHKEIYGAIWTEKGLIYVAKMNGQGKFELL